MRRTFLVFGLALLAASFTVYMLSNAQVEDGTEWSCRKSVDEYRWVLIFGDLFPLPRSMFLFANSMGNHYFEDRNYPGNRGVETSAISVGSESEYKENWLAREGDQQAPSQTFRDGKLTIEVFLRPDGKRISHVHITDGHEYVALLGPVAQKWQELVDVARRIRECWKI